jgi:ubiquitin thioesterase OTU1
MSTFRVRLRLPSSKQETLSLPSPVTIQALLEGIQPFVDVDMNQIRLRLAYPPKAIDVGSPTEWHRNVKEIGINNGEGLVVRIGGEATSAESTSADIPTQHEPPPPEPVQPVPVQQKPSFPNTFSVTQPVAPVKPASPVKRGPSVQDEPPEISVEGGTVVLRIMADDNSCMYSSSQAY